MGTAEAATIFPGYSRVRIDDEIVNPALYANEDEIHALFSKLCKEDPVRLMEPAGFRPFWSIAWCAFLSRLHLARMVIRALYNGLLPRLKSIEIAGKPRNTHANFVSGLKTMPVRFKFA